MNVLIIEDEEPAAARLEKMLKDIDPSITVMDIIVSVKSSINFFKKNTAPDLVLMDVVMPGINGFQATRQITKGTETSHIPVVIVTTKDQETDRVWGKRQGASDYLTKPVDESLLMNVIKTLIPNK